MKKFVRVPLSGMKVEEFQPNVVELAEILPDFGFRPLTDATPEKLPVGSVVVIYNCRNHTMLSAVVVHSYSYLGFYYIPLGDLDNVTPQAYHMDKKYDFKDKIYKVIHHLPEESSTLQPGLLSAAIEGIGFQPLEKATPEDLPEGSLVLLCHKESKTVSAVIVRILSMSNKRFLYWTQSPNVAGDWHPCAIMDELDSFSNYSYCVIA